MASRRTSFAAASRLLAPSAATTTASSLSSVPGSRAARQSGSRLKVVWLSGQYQRATRTPCGVLRSYVPCRAKEQPPCGCFGHCSSLASRHAWAVTYCSPVSPVSKRSCTGHGPTGVHSPRASFLFSERPRLRPHPPCRQAVKPWTRPADRSASYGPCGQPVDKLALAHRLTTLADLAPTAPPLPQQQG